MKNICLSLLAIASLSTSLLAAPMDFDFKDPKGVNNATFKLDAPLEAINGSATGITGTVKYDPAAPETISGKIVIATESLHVGNPKMNEHLHSPMWMDVTKFPEITFETAALKNAATKDGVTTADVTGKLTIKGIAKEITVPVKINYLPGKLKARFPMLEGDLLVLRSNFTIKRSDFGIMPGQMEEKVSDEIALSLSIAGMYAKK